MARVVEMLPGKDGGGFPFPVEDISIRVRDCYNSNSLVKKARVAVQLNELQTMEFIRCKRDPIYFIETYLRIVSIDEGVIPFKLYDYQKQMIESFVDNRYSINNLARQAGKCVTLNTVIKIKNKITGIEHDVLIGEFYEWQRFCKYIEEFVLK